MYENRFKEIPSNNREGKEVRSHHEDIKRIPNLELDENITNWKERHHETFAPGHYALRR